MFSAVRANAGLDLIGPLARVVDRHWYVLGEEVRNFEREFARYVGVEHCISVANGSDALELALRAVGVENGSKVVAVANAGFYGSTAIRALGALPVYVEIDPASLTMCPRALEQTLEHRPAAIIVTHLYGRLADIESIADMARIAGIPLVEDCAQAHGARLGSRQAGSFGDVACFSFYPTKNLGALGDGGAVLCNDDSLDVRLRQLRQYGWSSKYHVAVPGGRNSRMDELQAAVLREKLPHLDSWNAQRKAIARRYSAAFRELGLEVPEVGDDYVAHLYVLQVPQRAHFVSSLAEHGIATDIHYPVADYLQAAYSPAPEFSLPLTEAACASVVSLPCFPGLSDAEVQQVIDAVVAYFNSEDQPC
nr:DegT/DnrJ/EryC1/StrS family aminotransferase [Pseudomonas subflava]